MSIASLAPQFAEYASQTLPGPDGHVVSEFRPEPYKTFSPYGPERFVHELLAVLPAGMDNEQYFSGIHRDHLGHDVDKHLVFSALDFAQEKDLFPVAINIYLQSGLDVRFVENVLDYMNYYDVQPNQLVLELLEHDTPTEGIDFSALELGRKAGIRWAMDDFNPKTQMDRLRLLSPYCEFLKFDKNVMWDFRDGKFPELPAIVRQIKKDHPHLQIIAEGVPLEFLTANPGLFDASQSRGPEFALGAPA